MSVSFQLLRAKMKKKTKIKKIAVGVQFVDRRQARVTRNRILAQRYSAAERPTSLKLDPIAHAYHMIAKGLHRLASFT